MQMNVVKYAVFFGLSLCLIVCLVFLLFFCNLPALSCKKSSTFGCISAVTAHGKFSSQAHGWAAWTVCERNYCGTSRFTGFIFIP